MIHKMQVHELKDYESLCERVVKHVLSYSEEKIAKHGRFTIALAGGSTPKGVYALMASEEYRNQFDWEKIHFFWGDERWVPSGHSRRNDCMATETLFAKVDIPAVNIHAFKVINANIELSADAYEKEIMRHFEIKENEIPRFDLILLGLGQDGHIASLFPNSEALHEKRRLVVSVFHERTSEHRITFTFPVLNRAESLFVMVSGSEKAKVLKKVLEAGDEHMLLPAQELKVNSGEVLWFVDRAAAELLS